MDNKDIELRVRARYEGKQTLSGVTKDIQAMSAALKDQQAAADKGEADAKDLETAYGKLERTLRGVSAALDLSRRWEQQSAALEKVRQRLDAARQKQEQFDASLTQGVELTNRQVREQDRLARAVERATASMSKAQARVDGSAARLRAYGIDTAKVRDAQSQMTDLILNGNAALAKQEMAIDKAAAAQKRLADSDTAAALGRIKAQVLALASAWVGVHQGINLAEGSIDAFSQREGVKNQLALSVGNDRAAIDAEYEYVKAQSERIGVEVDRALQGYAKFSAAASQAGRDRQEIRYIWEAFAEVGRVANLSADNLDGVYKALEQAVSKGKIQAEELRGQLGDRLFGAFQIAAKALKDQFPDLDKAMENGLVTSEQLVEIAEQYRKTVADQLPAAMSSLAAEQARYTNAVLDFKLTIADAGFADAFRAALADITEALKSEDGKKFAESIAAGFSLVADAAGWLVKHVDEVTAVTKALFNLWALNMAGKAAADTLDYAKSLKTLAADMQAVVKGLGLVRGAFMVLQAAVVGWSIGSYLQEEFAVVRKAGVYMVTALDEAWTRIKGGAALTFEEIPRFAKNAFADVANAATWGMRKTLEAMQAGFQAIGREDLAAKIEQTIGDFTVGYAQESGRAAEIKRAIETQVAWIRKTRDEMLADAERATTAKFRTAAITTARPDITPGKTGSIADDEKGIAKRDRQVEQITRALETLDAKIDRTQSDSLQAQLDSIDSQYAGLSRKIAALGGTTGAAFAAELESKLNQLRTQVIAKFNDGIAQEHAALLAKLDAVDAAAGKKSKTDLDARLAAIRTQYESTYREIEAFREKLAANGRSTADADSARARLDAGIAELRQLETQRFYKDELKQLEGELNDVLSIRSDRLKAIADQEAASLITSSEARQQTEAAITSIQPRIDSLVETARAFAESLRGAFDPIAIDNFIAALDRAKNSGTGLTRTFQLTAKDIDSMIAGRAVQAFDSMAEAIGGAVAGTQSWGDALDDTGQAFLKFAADFLREIAMMIIQAQVLKAIQNSGGGGWLSSLVNAAVQHSGGAVGGVQNRTRGVSPFVFRGAPRYHSGGLVGLAPDEYPAILKRNEEVLTEDDPRNILNGGGAQGGAAPMPQDISIVNYVDSLSFMSSALSTSAGRKLIINTLSAERSALRAIVGMK